MAEALSERKQIKPRATGQVTRTVETDGFEPFDITFQIPGQAANVTIGLLARSSDREKAGENLMRLVADFLKSWTLEPEFGPPTFEALDRLPDAELVYEIVNQVQCAGDDRGN